MATLVLTAVGTAFGGPIGAALGAIVGQRVDQELFAPKPRHGPRLGELSVQTSSYGTAIPKIFGTMRVAGTVIWATDLVERKSTGGGGKGRPKTISYAYSANFAVALSGRRLRAVRRIWADGKLLRGAAGDFKTPTGFRLHPGDEDQAPDPLIAAAEGEAFAPAFRGLAYALFEDFQLEDYGNRIPSLTFEVEADAGPVAIGTIAAALSEGDVVEGPTPALLGFAASGDSVRGALEAIAGAVPLSLADDGAHLTIRGAPAAATAIGDETLTGHLEVARRADGAIPGEVSLAYYERARDFQTGLQGARRSGPVQRSERLALAAALDAASAKALAEHRLAALWAGRTSAKAGLGWRRLDLRPGAAVAIAGLGGRWKIDRRTIGPMSVSLELTRLAPGPLPGASATAGRAVAEPDLLHGPSMVRLVDLPLGAGDRPQLFALAAGASPGWRRAAVLLSLDGGAGWSEAGGTAGAAVLGTALAALPAASPALRDIRNEIEVELLHDGMWLEGRSDQALDGGENLALVGAELVQFGDAEPIGSRRFRLRRLLRGRRGTEWAAALHEPGEPFALLRPDSMMPLDVPREAVGSEARVLALGVGDGAEGASTSLVVIGEALRPPPPVHLRARIAASGDLEIRWVRRSRGGWAWADGTDAPLGEEREAYRLVIAAGAAVRTVDLFESHWLYTAAAQAADGAAPPFSISVSQTGTFAASRPAKATFG